MTHLELLGNAAGSLAMYWGAGTFLVALWLLAALLSLLTNTVLQKVTGTPREWSAGWFDTLQKAVNRLEFRSTGWILGLSIQVWYGGYAADLVRAELSRGATSTVHATAVAGIALSGAVFVLLSWHHGKKSQWFWQPLGVLAASLLAYVFFLGQPQLSSRLARAWRALIGPLLGAMLDAD